MTPTELADRLQKMDWSGTSLQHQLAVTAACATLRGLEKEPAEAAPTAQILSLPTSHTVRLLDLTGQEFARSSFRDIRKAWGWVQSVVAKQYGTHPFEIDCAAGWNGCDVVTFGGTAVAQVCHGLPSGLNEC